MCVWCVRVSVCACVRACVRECVRACVRLGPLREGNFGICNNRSFSWVGEKVKDRSIPSHRVSFGPHIQWGHLSRVVVAQ